VFYPPEAIERRPAAGRNWSAPRRTAVFEGRGLAPAQGRGRASGRNVIIHGDAFTGRQAESATRRSTRDLTERRKTRGIVARERDALPYPGRGAYADLRDRHARTPDGDYIADVELPVAEQIHGFNRNEIIGTHYSRLMVADGEQRAAAQRNLNTAAGEGTLSRRKTGAAGRRVARAVLGRTC